MKLQRYFLFLVVVGFVPAACNDSRLKVRAGEGQDADVEMPADGPSVTVDVASPWTDAPLQPDAPPTPDAEIPTTDTGPTVVCGDGVIGTGELCDDGNARPGDGCSGLCQIEPNYICPTVGQPCQSTVVCGDGKVVGGESCDDGNAAAGDGCSPMCEVELGWACATPGMPCMKVVTAICGDGLVNAGEQCDDGNAASNDGCSTDCKLEMGWTCPMPAKACVRVEYCGDGVLNGADQCDDGNVAPGDGCSGTCKNEPFFTCPMPGKPCVSTIICGDGKVIGDEACDDGNTAAGDGCGPDCKQVEAGWSCPNASGVGGACTKLSVPACGDGRLDFGEYCDDGNKNAGDGCSATCTVEPGYTCPTAGATCKLIGWCGDGRLSVADGEQCDDSNKNGGDGCSAACIIEANYVCPVVGQPCQSTVVCGDNKVNGAETCDDGNKNANDGCSSTCTVETGWTCLAGNVCRPTKCGDGIKVGPEQCDDGNTANNDGCSSTCKLEGQDTTSGNGWVCPTPGQACVRTVCNDGNKQGSEPCDDGNDVVGDGCTPYCQVEPTCPAAGGACSSRCGDGLILPTDQEECDDGNNIGGDGCSPTCKIEPGYACTNTTGVLPTTLLIPVVFRDVIARTKNGSTRHPDFETFAGDDVTLNLVQSQLGTDGKPVFANHCTTSGVTAACPWDQQLTTQANFDQWYRDVAGVNIPLVSQFPLVRQTDGSYFYPNGAPTQQLFPLDGMGWVAMNKENPYQGHNFGFTSEVRYWFQFAGGEKLTFAGDDDVWVFINKKLALDVGGLHPRQVRSVTLNTATATTLGLTVGSIYEIVLFHAERHTNASNFNLTLNGFVSAKSTCNSVCGDGIVAGTEQCDLGTARNTGAYGTCNANCTLPPRCGDAALQSPPEQCDDGVNLTTYGGTAMKCAPGCVWAGRCGDGKIDGASGEACDEGAGNGTGYGHCTTTCQLGPRCGDGAVTNSEECDDGMNNGTPASSCTAMCVKKCGNGMVDAGEQCDDGKANNTGGYGKCTSTCLLGPRCGDGIKNGTEACDDGKNDGSYGTCTSTCGLGPRCGDGVIQQAAGEVCDAGAMNQAAGYGKNVCTTRCKPAPYCGDHQVDVANGEKCDDGVNSGQPGSCLMDCSGVVPLPSCGDGTVQAPEQCDDGAANGTANSHCDVTCKKKCGNGFKDPGEACDDGKNDGSYGTCNADCTLAGYCGDGVKNGAEQCDQGAGNAANPYGPGKCTTMCTTAPYCGDGRIQTVFGEACDGGSACDAMCKMIIIK